MDFQSKLHQLRKQKGYTQEELAESIGVTRQAVTKWETSSTLPDIEKLLTLSEIFQVSIDYLVKEDEPCTKSSIPNACFNIGENNIFQFLCRAKRATYAGKGNKNEVSSRPTSYDYLYEENDYKYIDTYIGNERFAGEEAIFIKNIPYWSMNYIGKVLKEEFSGDFLKEALLKVPFDKPFRGPGYYHNGYFTYVCNVEGSREWFYGEEKIYYRDETVYECLFHGGALK